MKTLSIDAIKQSGGFVSGLIKKTVKWNDNEAVVYVKPASYATVVNRLLESNDLDRAALNIAESIRDEEGNPIFTAEDITGKADPDRGPICEDLTMELLRVIGEVSGAEKKTK